MRFAMDDYAGPVPEGPIDGEEVLAAWVCRDVNRWFPVLLDALAMVDEVGSGREPFAPWDSEGFAVRFDPSKVEIASLHGDRRSETHTVGEVRSVLEAYWAFLAAAPERSGQRPFRPDLPEWQAALLQWESIRSRTHPYRGRLGIPADGPA